jgi:hypothetical protein
MERVHRTAVRHGTGWVTPMPIGRRRRGYRGTTPFRPAPGGNRASRSFSSRRLASHRVVGCRSARISQWIKQLCQNRQHPCHDHRRTVELRWRQPEDRMRGAGAVAVVQAGRHFPTLRGADDPPAPPGPRARLAAVKCYRAFRPPLPRDRSWGHVGKLNGLRGRGSPADPGPPGSSSAVGTGQHRLSCRPPRIEIAVACGNHQHPVAIPTPKNANTPQFTSTST